MMTTSLSEKIEAVLRGAGLSDQPGQVDSSIHSWRCEHPDRYGACTCFRELVAELVDALVPDHGVLVSFETQPVTETDWEHSYSTSSTDLVKPQVLAHRLSEQELAELAFQIEAVGTLGESDAYSDLDALIAQIGAEPAQRVREQTRTQTFTLTDMSEAGPS